MKYMLLIYVDFVCELVYGMLEFEKMINGYMILSEKMVVDGVMLVGEGLKEVIIGIVLCVCDEKVEMMDGFFVEMKEYLGGFYLIDVLDYDMVFGYVVQILSVEYGMVEVCLVMDYFEVS